MAASDEVALAAFDTVRFPDNPLLQHKVTALRKVGTPPSEVRKLVKDLSTFMAYEACRDLPMQVVEEASPMAGFAGASITGRVALVPILRAGSGMLDAMLDLFPDASVYHLGLFRDKVSLTPTEYYSKLPGTQGKNFDHVFILDPMIATGGTAVAAVNLIQDWGCPLENIKFLSLVASMNGIATIIKACPGLNLWVAAADQNLTKEGYVVPGIGDAGDRLYNTLTGTKE